MPDKRTPEKKALDYVESLGLHTVYSEAVNARNVLDEVLTALGEARDKRRALESAKHDREMELLQIEGGVHPDLSIAAMDRHLKITYYNDSALITIRSDLLSLANEIDGLELDQRMAETDIKIAVARLNELGGYLQFAAALKEASEARKSSEAYENDPDPWRS